MVKNKPLGSKSTSTLSLQQVERQSPSSTSSAANPALGSLVTAWWQLSPEARSAYLAAPPGVDVEESLGESDDSDSKRSIDLPLRSAEQAYPHHVVKQSEMPQTDIKDRLKPQRYTPKRYIPNAQGVELTRDHQSHPESFQVYNEESEPITSEQPLTTPKSSAHPSESTKPEVLQDFKMQLMLLELQNQKQLEIARSEAEECEACHVHQDYDEEVALPKVRNKRQLQSARGEQERENHQAVKKRKQKQGSLIGDGLACEQYGLKDIAAYTKPFCDFLTDNPTIWHAVDYFKNRLDEAGFKKLSPRSVWNDKLKKGGKYYTSRNGTALIAFTVGDDYKSGHGVAMIAGHVDALTARLKPISTKKTVAGYAQLGIAPWAGGLNETWWDRDLGIGGRVLVKDSNSGKIITKHVKLGWPIAKIPTLAPHFGIGMMGKDNPETEMIPIIGLDNDMAPAEPLGGEGTFTATQPPKLVRAVADELSVKDYSTIIGWELELYDIEPARTMGLDHEIISAPRIDDKLCSWSAMEALLSSSSSTSGSLVKLVALFDDEELGSEARQGAKGTFLPGTIARIAEAFTKGPSANALGATYANSFLLSADVVHAGHPNFLGAYEPNHIPRLNTGLVIHANFQGHTTTDGVSTAVLQRIAEKTGNDLQFFMVRNGMRSGGTVGPMLSTSMGCRAVDVGAPMLGMHSIRATTGALEPGIGVKIYKAFFDEFESVDAEFAQ